MNSGNPYRENLHEIKKGGIDVTDGLKFDYFDKLKELNNLNIKVIELTEDKTSSQLDVSEHMKKDVVKVKKEISQNLCPL